MEAQADKVFVKARQVSGCLVLTLPKCLGMTIRHGDRVMITRGSSDEIATIRLANKKDHPLRTKR